MVTREAAVREHLEKGGFEERQAMTLADALVAMTSHLATREQVDERSDATNERLDGVNERLDGIKDGTNERLDGIKDGMNQRFDGMNDRIVAIVIVVTLLIAAVAGLSVMVSNILLSL